MAVPLGRGGEGPAIKEKITFLPLFRFVKVPTAIKLEGGAGGGGGLKAGPLKKNFCSFPK